MNNPNPVLIVDGVELINVTPHSLTFQNVAKEVVSIPSNPDFIVNAKAVEAAAGKKGNATLVKVTFVTTPEAEALVAKLEAEHPDAILVGSIIAAQAFPGRVFAMTPAEGFERVAPADKRMNTVKFSTF